MENGLGGSLLMRLHGYYRLLDCRYQFLEPIRTFSCYRREVRFWTWFSQEDDLDFPAFGLDSCAFRHFLTAQ